MTRAKQHNASLRFDDLETRYGRVHAVAILKTLERFEGVREERVTKLSCDERLKNVFRVMKESMRYQTRH